MSDFTQMVIAMVRCERETIRWHFILWIVVLAVIVGVGYFMRKFFFPEYTFAEQVICAVSWVLAALFAFRKTVVTGYMYIILSRVISS